MKWTRVDDPELSGTQLTLIENVDLTNCQISSISTELSWLSGCKNLKVLNLSDNNIQTIDGWLTGLTDLRALNLSGNQISKIGDSLSELVNLRHLSLNRNRITQIKGLENLRRLQLLDLSSNSIEKIEGIDNLVELTNLCLSSNRIQKIEGLSSLDGLVVLSLMSNQITTIENLDGLVSLSALSLWNNQITVVPNVFVWCPRLSELYVEFNAVERWHPAVEEHLLLEYVMVRRNTLDDGLAVYSDPQSVHSVNVQSCIRKNIVKLLETDRLTPFREISEVTESILADAVLPESTKSALIEYSADAVNEITALPGVRFADVLIPVWNRIVTLSGVDSEKSLEVKRVLAVEMADAECVCFTGRVSRLVNSLTGFFPDITVEIGKSDQVSNIVMLTRRKLTESSEGYSKEDHVRLVTAEMAERGYNIQEIEVWTAAITEME